MSHRAAWCREHRHFFYPRWWPWCQGYHANRWKCIKVRAAVFVTPTPKTTKSSGS